MVKRREWSDEKKRAIVAETRAVGVSVSSIAKRHKVNIGQLHGWARDPRFGGEAREPDFVEGEDLGLRSVGRRSSRFAFVKVLERQ